MNKYSIVIIVFLATILSQTAIDLYIPSMPVMQQQLHTSVSLIQLTLTIYLLGFALSQLFFGRLTDQYGRRPALLLGQGIFCLATLGIVLIPHNIYWLLVCRLIEGLGMGAAPVAIRTVIRDLFKGKELSKIISFVAMSWSTIPIVAPLLGGYIETYLNWEANFQLLLAVSIIFTGIIWRYFPETKPKHLESMILEPFWKACRQIAKDKKFIIFTGACMSAGGLIYAYATSSAFLLQEKFGISPLFFGWIAFIVGFSCLLGSAINGFLVSHYGHQKMIVSSLIAMAIGAVFFLILGFMPHPVVWIFVLSVAIIFFGEGWIYPNLASLAYEAIQHNLGLSSALFGMLNIASGAIISGLVAHLSIQSMLPLAIIFIILISIIIFSYATNKDHN